MDDSLQDTQQWFAKRDAEREAERQRRQEEKARQQAYRDTVDEVIAYCSHELPKGTSAAAFCRQAVLHLRRLIKMIRERGTADRIGREYAYWSKAKTAPPGGMPEDARLRAIAAGLLKQAADSAIGDKELRKAFRVTADYANRGWGLGEAMEAVLTRLDYADWQVAEKPPKTTKAEKNTAAPKTLPAQDDPNWSEANTVGDFRKQSSLSATTFWRLRHNDVIRTRPAGGNLIQVYMPDFKKYQK